MKVRPSGRTISRMSLRRSSPPRRRCRAQCPRYRRTPRQAGRRRKIHLRRAAAVRRGRRSTPCRAALRGVAVGDFGKAADRADLVGTQRNQRQRPARRLEALVRFRLSIDSANSFSRTSPVMPCAPATAARVTRLTTAASPPAPSDRRTGGAGVGLGGRLDVGRGSSFGSTASGAASAARHRRPTGRRRRTARCRRRQARLRRLPWRRRLRQQRLLQRQQPLPRRRCAPVRRLPQPSPLRLRLRRPCRWRLGALLGLVARLALLQIDAGGAGADAGGIEEARDTVRRLGADAEAQ